MDSETICIVKPELSFSLREISKLYFLHREESQPGVASERKTEKKKPQDFDVTIGFQSMMSQEDSICSCIRGNRKPAVGSGKGLLEEFSD